MSRIGKTFYVYGVMPAMAVMLSGCAITRPTDPYQTVPHRHSVLSNQAELSSPVQRPEVSLQGPLTLEQAVHIALVNNPEIAASQWDVMAADAGLDMAQAGRWPSLSIEGGYQRSIDDQRLVAARYNGEPGIFDRGIYRGDLILRMPLFSGGKFSSEIDAAMMLRLSREKRLVRTRQELVFNVSSAFYSIIGQQEVVRALEFSAGVMEEHRRQVAAFLEVQKAARVDLLRTEVRLANLRQNLVLEQNALAIGKRLLANLLGLEGKADAVEIDEAIDEAPDHEKMDTASLESFVSEALQQRSDYLASRAEVQALARRVDSARADRWPTVGLSGNYGVRSAGSGEREDVGAIGVGVAMPLFDGKRIVSRIDQERARLEASRQRLRKLELQICQDLEVAVLNIRSSRERINVTRQSVEQAEEGLRIVRMMYGLGKGSITDVLDAQSALLLSETDYARSLADFHIAMARLRLATGENVL